MTEQLLTTGEMARRTGSTLRTVRFYEEAGLLTPCERAGGGHRHFRASDLSRLQLILDLREAGLALSEIRQLLELKGRCRSAKQASREMSGLLEERIAAMQRKIDVLRSLREELGSMMSVLTECSECGDQPFPGSCEDCEVLERPALPRAVRVLWRS
jgi:DNA-binding transcriptional MerR regulator